MQERRFFAVSFYALLLGIALPPILCQSPFTLEGPRSCTENDKVTQSPDIQGKESEFVELRKQVAAATLSNWLHLNVTTENMPVIGIAVSGGGYRAAVGGFGSFLGFSDPAQELEGVLSSLFNSSVYLSGLSGGAWLVANVMKATFDPSSNAKTIRAQISQARDRLVRKGLLTAFPSYKQPLCRDAQGTFQAGQQIGLRFYADQINSVRQQHGLPNNTLITWWGAMCAGRFLTNLDNWFSLSCEDSQDYKNATYMHFSDLTILSEGFNQAQLPFPIITAVSVPPSQNVDPDQAFQFEFTPYAAGCSTPGNVGFIPVTAINSWYNSGVPTTCWNGDTLSYIIGVSSSAFELISNVANVGICSSLSDTAFNLCTSVRLGQSLCNELVFANSNSVLNQCNDLISRIQRLATDSCTNRGRCSATFPNWLFKTSVNSPLLNDRETFNLVDGGLGGNLPLHPLWNRNLSHVVALDYSFNTDSNQTSATTGRPNGQALIWAQRYFRRYNISFPDLPANQTSDFASPLFTTNFLNQPVVIGGCTPDSERDYPVIFYIPLLPQQGVNPQDIYWSTVRTALLGVSGNQFDTLFQNSEQQVASAANAPFQLHVECLLRKHISKDPNLHCNCPVDGNFLCFDLGQQTFNCSL